MGWGLLGSVACCIVSVCVFIGVLVMMIRFCLWDGWAGYDLFCGIYLVGTSLLCA